MATRNGNHISASEVRLAANGRAITIRYHATQFEQLDPNGKGSAVIHEMLHTLGLPEYPYGYTSDQITDMVNQWCP